MGGTFGLNGTGRIGRLLIRKAFAQKTPEFALTAINSIHPAKTIAHLLKYDSTHGRWHADIAANDRQIMINGHVVEVVCEHDPARIPWQKLGVDVVIDATGKFTSRKDAAKHLAAGASTVIVTAPGSDLDLTVVMGVNQHRYKPQRHALLSAASCTTICAAPVLDILDQAFQVKNGWLTTVHAFTNDQNHLDNPHRDLRRARSCFHSIIPTTTGIGKALTDVLPHLAPVVRGVSIRVPVPDVSLIDLTVQVKKSVTKEAAEAAFRQAAAANYARYVALSDEPLVSTDFIGCEKSAVIDGLSLNAGGGLVKVLAWYDNEWAYACRVAELANYVAAATRKEMKENGGDCHGRNVVGNRRVQVL
ncbi:MAG TPA: type I glyceraldehyde-3-phosphate dehydrogenase [Bacilli bacterium]